MFDSLPTNAQAIMTWTPEHLKPFMDDLLGRDLSAATVEQFLADWTKVNDLLGEAFSRLNVATTQNTADEDAKKRFITFLEVMAPYFQPIENELKKKLLKSGLEPKGFEIPLRNMRVEAEIFREANVPLFIEERKLGVAFDEILGGMKVTWEGKEIPLTELQPEGQNPNRAVREKAWRAAHQVFLNSRERINDLWGKFLDLRVQQAKNVGFDNYIDFRWKQMGRFDYTPADNAKFHAAIEQVVVPATQRMFERKRKEMGLAALRPWDLNVDPTHNQAIVFDSTGKPALHPYKNVEEMESKAESIFSHVDPALGAYWGTMRKESLLDLGSRMNKAMTGYCTTYPVIKRPFIFMNAVGIHDDVQTMLHEAGHAFHAFECANLPYTQMREYPIEFAEVASMSMELLAAPYLSQAYGGFYSDADAARARISHFEGMLTFWPYMATVDAFQLWVYSNIADAKDPAKCDAKWAELWGRYIKGIDWSGLDEEMKTGWHRKLHIHQIPFYYVEYGLAQLGAAQVWRNSLRDQAGAVASYRKGLALGGAASLPALFQAAGATFAFDAGMIGELVSLIEKTITELSAVN
ncbi:MAG: M3 family oligoendopeptidase [Anaerolineales bacterium]|nr:M3 family oligoendopeptidase [Anaerolineales bacterium]